MRKLLIILSLVVIFPVQASIKPWFAEFIKPGSIVIIKSERRLYLFAQGGQIDEYPIAIGKVSTPSPSGEYKIERMSKNPTWYPSDAIRYENPNNILPKVVLPGPKNPLGPRAIYLSNSVLRIHGTTKPNSIGRAVSHGCFRMYNHDIIDLYNKVIIGMPIYVFK